MRLQHCAVMLLGSVAVLLSAQQAMALPDAVVVETRIKEGALSFQAGMKSRHTVKIDYSSRSLSSDFLTGVTNLVGIELGSVRDRFTVYSPIFSGEVASFIMEGQTASAVGVLPNINYRFTITVDRAAREIVVSGCHDGYPSYSIIVGDTEVYSFEQEFLAALFGSCDIVVASRTVKY